MSEKRELSTINLLAFSNNYVLFFSKYLKSLSLVFCIWFGMVSFYFLLWFWFSHCCFISTMIQYKSKCFVNNFLKRINLSSFTLLPHPLHPPLWWLFLVSDDFCQIRERGYYLEKSWMDILWKKRKVSFDLIDSCFWLLGTLIFVCL